MRSFFLVASLQTTDECVRGYILQRLEHAARQRKPAVPRIVQNKDVAWLQTADAWELQSILRRL